MDSLARYLRKRFDAGRLRRIYDDLRLRRSIDKESERLIIDLFHNLYYHSGHHGKSWNDTYWQGVRVLKCPLDLWLYQEILVDLKPDLIVECGTRYGGSALFLASMCDLNGRGRVLTIDVEHQPNLPRHERIEYYLGSSTDERTVQQVISRAEDAECVLVILDSDHRRDHVLQELRVYGPLVTRGSYMIVEDSCVNGHPVAEEFGPGPYEAIESFLEENRDFVIDRGKDKFLLTFNPNGFLRKVAGNSGNSPRKKTLRSAIVLLMVHL